MFTYLSDIVGRRPGKSLGLLPICIDMKSPISGQVYALFEEEKP